MFYTDCIAFDYITHTSWVNDAVKSFTSRMEIEGVSRQEKRIMQYTGHQYDNGGFVGSGVQDGNDHYMTRMSGKVAADRWPIPLLESGTVTRIDIQYTTKQNHWLAFPLRGYLRSAGIRATIFENSNDLDHTVYIGSRSSERFARIYPKYDDQGQLYVRVEIELKGDLAKTYWSELKNKERTVGQIMQTEVEWLILRKTAKMDQQSSLVQKYIEAPLYRLISTQAQPKPELEKKERDSIQWLYKTVLPALKRIANEGDKNNRLDEWLQLAIEECYTGDLTTIYNRHLP